MRKLLTTIFLALVACLSVKANFVADGEYYIWLNIYEKLLGTNEAGNGPALSAYGTKSDGYVFVAEASGESGYFLLKQKSSGKYLAASGSNDWSIVFEDSRSTDTRFRWKMTGPDSYAYLTNKKDSGSYVGIDGAKKGADYVSIYYDKRKSSHGQFSVIPAVGSSWDDARQAYKSSVYKNAQDIQEIDYCQLNDKTIDCSDAIDIHITSNDNPMLGSSTVNLGSDRTWLIFDNIVPSQVISKYLQYVTINGETAQKDVNCRVAIYLNGAAVIPLPDVVMACEGTEGHFELAVGNYTNLAELEPGQSNTMTSFTLRRGYMATIASGTNGSGHSHVYVADHADQEIILPEALDQRVSSVNIKPWQYVSKKGWGNTGGSYGGSGLRATWYWSWSAGYDSTDDMEYVPCRQHRYWPSTDEVNNKTATASLSLNEPEHSEQHTSDKCSCGGVTDAWTAYKNYNSTFQAGGGRIGSPQPTDFSYLTQYFKYVDENNNYSRCDFAVTHAYWDVYDSSSNKVRDADAYAKFVTDQCWTIWHDTGRPVWLTEMEVGASWIEDPDDDKIGKYITNNEKGRQYLQALLQRLEESDYIERYAIYGVDWWCNYMYWDATVSKGLTPAGEVYRDHRSTFAYNAEKTKVPVWWRPSIKKPTVAYEVNPDEQTITFTIGNTNTDATETITLEYKPEGGDWQEIIAYGDDRNLLEGDITYTTDLNMEGGKFRATTTTIYGGSSIGDEVNGPVMADIEPLYQAIKAHSLGFEYGEYAPYTNQDGAKAIAVAKEVKHYDTNLHTKVVNACQQIEKAVWTPNAEELDAIYDGRFATTAANSTSGNIKLPGWTNKDGSIRFLVKDVSKDPGLAYADGKAAVFSWGGTTLVYGSQTEYSMPLAKYQIYELTLKVSGWRDGDLPKTFKIEFDGVEQKREDVTVKRINNNTENPFQTLSFQVVPTADNSFLKIYTDKHFTIADLSLRRLVEKGDVDGSGVIDINDVKALVSSILGDKPVGFFDKAADLNGDDNVDISDVTELIKLLLPN